jgi:DNA-directed RNA polymerase subunit RPC12/RpoP
MSDYVQIDCGNCAGAVEAPRASAGTTVACPHCSAEILIPPRSRALELWSVLAVVLIVGGAFGYVQMRNKPKPPVAVAAAPAPTNAPPPAAAKPKSLEDLKVGRIEIDQPKGSGLRYAVGTLKNESDYPRYGITVELALFDQRGQELSKKAPDYLQMLQPRKEWRFRALVLDSKAVSAKVASIREEE